MFYLRARGTRKPTRGDSNPGSGERGRGRQREHARRAGAKQLLGSWRILAWPLRDLDRGSDRDVTCVVLSLAATL